MYLNDELIDKLMKPFMDRQEEIDQWVLEQIAKKINAIGEISQSDLRKLIKMRDTEADVHRINKELGKMTNKQVIEIKKLIQNIALQSYLDAKPFYDYRYKKYIPYKQNVKLQRMINAIARRTQGTYKNIAKAQAFMIRDSKGNLVQTPLAEAYQKVVDRGIQAASGGIVDYNTAMRKTLKDLINGGVQRAEYITEKGRRHSQRLDTAVRRNVLDGIRETYQTMQNIVGEEFGADGVEITVHAYPAPDHAKIQGHEFTKKMFEEKIQQNQQFTDINGNVYIPFKRQIGTLNCRHFVIEKVIGYSDPIYTEKQLQEILDRNEKGYTLPSGKHLTMYQCTQEQNRYELMVRKAKEGYLIASTAGDKLLAGKYKARVSDLIKKYKAFSKACGLSPRPNDYRVAGYK